MKYRIMTVIGALIFSFAFSNAPEIDNTTEVDVKPALVEEVELTDKERTVALYESFSMKNNTMPQLSVFEKAIKGYQKLDEAGKISNSLLTIVDFDLSSTKKRMWILNMDTEEVEYNTYVAHGKNTGAEFANKFSNTVNSLQSSLGFYVTGETYFGKNGLSLFIDGMEKNFNSNARKRYVVIHGADYAEPEFIDRLGRLGRSYGCPAVPNTIAKDLIHKIKGKSVVFIHRSNQNYLQSSSFLNS
ncbi:murein L,D-transpeptidase catalytic domain family protein [Christiangramia portivictoriae]|uniref:murein L,D-transpeptidase catalytic domain family protein n=1 Tax=Christiangramia portivictoriae TaxID=326069 RepID=UPI0004163026|nr:murein L,D-transpeptidase catalytic domain family protein [Christiangramia portivictoriae]